MNSNKKLASTVNLSYVLVSTAISLVFTPLMLRSYGQSSIGVYGIAVSITTYFAMLDLGMHNVTIRYIARFKVDGDIYNQEKYIGFVTCFYGIMSIIILMTSLIIYYNIPSIFSNSLTNIEITLLENLFICGVIRIVLQMLFNVYGGVVKAHEHFLFYNIVQYIHPIIRVLVVIPMIVLGLDFIYIIWMDVLCVFIIGVSQALYVRVVLFLKIRFCRISKSELADIFGYSGFIFINMIALQLFWASDNIILGIMTTATAVAIYSQGTALNSYYQTFGNLFSGFFMATATKMVVKKATRTEIALEMARIGRYIFYFIALVLIGFICVGRQFIVLWLGNDYMQAYYIAIIMMIPQSITFVQSYGANIMWAKNMHRKRAVPMLLIALLNCGITIILVQYIGILGAAVGSCFAYVIGYGVYTSWYYDKYVDIDMPLFYNRLIHNMCLPLSISLGLGLAIGYCFDQSRWSWFILQCLSISIIYCFVMYIFAMNSDEKSVLKNIALKILQHSRR